MIQSQKLSRPAGLFLAAVVASITLAIVAQATTTLVVPNAAVLAYNLAAGANSAVYTPVSDKPVIAMGVCTTVGVRGVGQVTLFKPSVAPQFIEWVGLESTAGAAITQGWTAVAGTHIVYLDFGHQVDLQVAGPTTVLVHNGAAAARTGTVTFIW